MDAKHPHDDEPSVTSHGRTGVSVSRRRFTRAGLSGSVVLGSLASKPVLGAVPYHCTVSGQVSGNLSRATAAGGCVIGASRSTWLLDTSWPTQIVRGVVPDIACYFPGTKGTAFNGFVVGSATLASVFYYQSLANPSRCTVVTSPNTAPAATMLQVLNTDPADPAFNTEIYQLARATVISLLNSYKFADYPVTALTVVSMFNATRDNGPYAVNSSVTWTRKQVIAYLKSLYPA